MIGQRLGHFRILERLGTSGLGEVYRARDEQLERDIALTIMSAGAVADPAARARRLDDARAASKLNHPNICAIHEVGEADPSAGSGQAVAFIATELVPGRPLGGRLAEGPLRPDELLRCGLQLSDALAYAHEHGVVHADLKASNVVVTPDGRVKVLGFGLVRALSRDELTDATTATPAAAAGRPGPAADPLAYLAPEQLRGQAADPRSDVWALGVLLHEMATGQRPFQGRTAFELSTAILSQTPPPLPVSVPVEVSAVVDRCLRKEPGERYRRASDVHAALEAVQSGAALPGAEQAGRGTRRRYWLGLAATAVIVVAVAGGYLVGMLSRRVPAPVSGQATHSLAVLPLANLSGDPAQQYFVDGLTDALINDLARIGGALRVTARASTAGYATAPKPVRQIARELGVDAVVEGSVAREGDLVRVTAALIDAATEQRLWSDRYERNLTSILALQADIARAVARAIKGALSPEEEQKFQKTREVNPRVYELYLRGMSLLQQATPEARAKGMEFLHRAIEEDPTDPLAYAGLADGYITIAHGADPLPDALSRARAAARTAFELDPTLPQASFALGVIKGYDEWDWEGGERELRHTIDLNPSFAMAHYHLAWFIALDDRRLPEAIEEHIRARDLDPLNPLHTAWLGQLYVEDGQYDKALDEATRAIELNPKVPIGYRVLSELYARQGKWDQAIAAMQTAVGADPAWRWRLGLLYIQAGRTAEARPIIAALEKARVTPWTAMWRARLAAALGDREAAFRWLNYEHPHIFLPWLRLLKEGTQESILLRDDPRFQELRRKMHIPD
jgi:TolB-like protein